MQPPPSEKIKSSIRSIPDFPKKGIIFRDISSALKEPEILQLISDLLYEKYKNAGITKVVGIESRGFILGGILAYRLHAGFVMIRKKGKLPGAKISYTYNLEYGTDTIEIHEHDLSKDDIVLLHDDLLATGGTVLAATQLLEKIGITRIHTDFLCELSELGGRKRIEEKYPVHTLVAY